MSQDWNHQTKLVNRTITEFNSGIRRIVLQCPTGSGKTRMIRMIVDYYKALGKTIYLVTHRTSLVEQLGTELKEAGIFFSYVLPGVPMLRCRVLVCSLMTLVRRFEKMKAPDMVIVDECHHSMSASYKKLFQNWPDIMLLGLTATPMRLDGKPLKNVYQKLITGPQIRELIDSGYLSDFQYYAPLRVDRSDIHKVAGEFNPSEVVAKVDTRVIIGDEIEHYKKYADHKPGIGSCSSIVHCEHMASQFREAGYKAEAIHSKLPKEKIARLLNGLKQGFLELLFQCELLGEGIDIKGAVVSLDCQLTASLTKFMQRNGRILRYSEGKTAIFLDCVGNWEIHGLPDDDRKWSLDGNDKVDQGVLIYKRCDGCYWPVKKSVTVCPYCGFAFETAIRAVRALPEHKPGELINVRSEIVTIPEWLEEHEKEIGITPNNKKLAIHEMYRVKTYYQAVDIAKKYGYAPTFARVVWSKVLKRR